MHFSLASISKWCDQSSVMDSSQIQALMQELASPSLDMDEEQVENSLKCCAILEDMSAERCRQVIKIANKGPVLQVYIYV